MKQIFLSFSLLLCPLISQADICSRSELIVSAAEDFFGKPCEQIENEEFNSSSLNAILHLIVHYKTGEKKLVLKRGDLAGVYNSDVLLTTPFDPNYKDKFNVRKNWKLVLGEGAFDGVIVKNDVSVIVVISGWEFENDADFSQSPFSGMLIDGALVHMHLNVNKGPSALPDDIFSGIKLVNSGTIKSLNLEAMPALKKLPTQLCKDITTFGRFSFHSLGVNRFDSSLFQNCKSLNEIHINHVDLEEIPEGAFAGLNLDYLSIVDHQIKSFPSSAFKGTVGLKRLTLSDGFNYNFQLNLAEDFLDSIKHSLTEVNFQYVKLENLSSHFFSNSVLLKTVEIHGPKFQKLPSLFCENCKSLEIVKIVNGKKDFNEIAPDAFHGLRGLRILDLYGNDFSRGIPKLAFKDLISRHRTNIHVSLPIQNELELRMEYPGLIYFNSYPLF
jgi:hypothetical protein